ncbi:hypothetical protein SOP56_02665 [Weissella confusa]|uniref:hypothetical protein n=1 Tax=Weissella confusa TaxID=1583 RepID=UPI002A76314B|nr:hypothetical protein [Weissella confusa]MDY2528760.1 hypothetical protein [Weissella confusa]
MTYLNTTRWINNDTSISDVDEAISKIISKNGQDILSRNISGIDFNNVLVTKVFDNTLEGLYLDSKIKFNAVKGQFEKNISGEVTVTNFFVVVYQLESTGDIYFIINRNTDAQRILRAFLEFNGKEELSKRNVALNSNLLMYLVYRVFEDQSNFSYTRTSADEFQIAVRNLTGIKGATETSNKLSADGTTISKLISTLSLLLEIKELQQVRLDTRMVDHESINIVLHNDGLIGVESTNYVGTFEDEPNDEKQTKLLLHIYLVVLPVILSEYNDASDENWGPEEISEFMNHIKEQLSEKIDSINTTVLEQQELITSKQLL